ncbi:hypothetical protein AB3M83_05030 [Microbacterium sp. 179-B 1A2 NHS]|uniref:hypothetical protein n=1 Tax=Microbacterium sp. 179-B 1A2 NHS TaxID=3142383 RepID=UPI0039A39A7A
MRPTAGIPAAALTAVALLALAGCTGTAEPAPAASDTTVASPSPTQTGAAPTPTATAADDVPVECESLTVPPGGTVSGEDLGPCLQAALVLADTGTLTLSGDELGGTVQYRHRPDFAFSGELETGDGAVAMSFVDGVMMLDSGDGPVVGDPESDDPDEQLAGVTGELYRVFSDPGFIADFIAAGETWEIGSETEELSPAGGDAVTAVRARSTAPFSWYDIPIDSYTVFFAEDFTPVSASSTTGFLGHTSSITQDFSGVGEPVSIEPIG